MKHSTTKPSEAVSTVSRRRFLGTAAAAAACAVLPVSSFARRRSGLGVRDIEGVQVGAISYSYRALPSSAEDILGYLKQAGLGTVELMGGPAEAFAGAPEEASEEDVRQWRLSAPMDKFEALGRMYRDEGVEIDILKLGRPEWSDEENDYAFNAARAVGARGISMEGSSEAASRMGPLASEHEMLVGFHNHTQVDDSEWSFDELLSHSPQNMLNLDIGHYVAGLGTSPVPVIEKYHDRISHLHLKDRKTPENGAGNVMWGEGDTPISDVLRLLQKEQYPITAMIELEYDIPEGSDVLQEMERCVAYCRDALS